MNRKRRTNPTEMPSYNLSLPVLLVMFIFFTILGGGLAYLAAVTTASEPQPTTIAFATDTLAPQDDSTSTPETPSPTITNTSVPQPTLTPLPYTVQEGDTCGAIATTFRTTIQTLIITNNLSADCYLVPGMVLQIPQPTPIPTSDAMATQSARKTQAACPTEVVTVQEGETIDAIANFMRVPAQAILDYNGKPSAVVFAGERLVIPLCMQTSDYSGATFTPTVAPPYPAPQLLQPPTGSYFATGEQIILQWAAAGELRENEYYLVTISDSTTGGTIVLEEWVKDTRFIVPESLQPTSDNPHIFEWHVGIVAQIGEEANGAPVFRSGGPDSLSQYFAWESN